MTFVMGMDQHRAQISAEWINTLTGEVSRARVAPADRIGVRKFLTALMVASSRSRWKRRRDGGSSPRRSDASVETPTWPSRRRPAG